MTATCAIDSPGQPPESLDVALTRVIEALEGYRYRFSDEKQLHAGIAYALTSHGISFEHEWQASTAHRLDFWCPPSIAIEVKIAGSLPSALHQVDGYLALPVCQAVVLASTRPWARQGAHEVPSLLRGKPLRFAHLKPRAF